MMPRPQPAKAGFVIRVAGSPAGLTLCDHAILARRRSRAVSTAGVENHRFILISPHQTAKFPSFL
jgi:hypothetical protein